MKSSYWLSVLVVILTVNDGRILPVVESGLELTLSSSQEGFLGQPQHQQQLLRIPGDVVFGGLFPMHEHLVPSSASMMSSTSSGGWSSSEFLPCGAVKEEKGIQRLEAMLYALDLINEDPEILPNITIGAVILDTCSSDTHALDQSMEFVRSYMNKVRFSLLPQ